jgi:ABC-type glutathione transport system ATPase component
MADVIDKGQHRRRWLLIVMVKLSHDIAVHCSGITKIYGTGDTKVLALRGVDLDVRCSELLMLVGPSGCDLYHCGYSGSGCRRM